MKVSRVIFILFLLEMLPSKVFAASVQTESTSSLVEYIDPAEFTSLKEELDFTKTKEVWQLRESTEDKQEVPDRKKPSGLSMFAGQLIYYVIILLIIIVIFGILFYLLFDKKDDRDTHLMPQKDEVAETLDIQEINLELLLSEALNSHDYKKAIRAEFLQLLQFLTSEGLIDWAIDKTNTDYLDEVKNSMFSDRLQKCIGLFEYYWYGDHVTNEKDYQEVASICGSIYAELVTQTAPS